MEVTARFEPRRAFVGEPVTLRVSIANRKRLPLPVVRLAIWLPPGLTPARGWGSPTVRGYQRRLSVGGRSEAVYDDRGAHPGTIAERDGARPFRHDARVARATRAARMFEERERFAGVRPYEPGDPLNRIHWKLTGHAAGLQTKLFEPTRTADVLLMLDLATGEPFWDSIYPEIAEDTIGWATFLARQAITAGWRVGLVANTHLSRGRGPLRVPPSARRGHEAALFAALARMPNEATSDLAPVLREAGRRLGRGTSAVVISPRPGVWLRQEMDVLRRRGAEVMHLSPLEFAS